ncbi:hypothetical protein BX600DRAFT_434366 [Xylariales sp. PMI_506]|nr:hypothetical protein BX600DRAFT_434366 [Xylariales sp. PMI_506]
MAAPDVPIVLFCYTAAPNARRVIWYLTLRGIPYLRCLQPPIMPRPDLKRLGVSYRRIPVLSIGRDVYADTRLILRKLEELYPPSAAHPSISAVTGEQRALERLLSRHSMRTVFMGAVMTLPSTLPHMSSPQFVADRADMANAPPGDLTPFSPEVRAARRPAGLCIVRDAVELLETTLLADGRDWVLGTESPTLADLEAVWPLHWANTVPGAYPADLLSAQTYPKVFAWIDRFDKAIAARGKDIAAPKDIKGEEAAKIILGSKYAEAESDVDAIDPIVSSQGLKKGQLVRVWPTDSGSLHKDVGTLVGVSSQEFIIDTHGEAGSVRLHEPRDDFKIQKVDNMKL